MLAFQYFRTCPNVQYRYSSASPRNFLIKYHTETSSLESQF